MSKQFVIGNWKLNGNSDQIKSVLGAVAQHQFAAEVGVCVPFPYLALAAETLKGGSVQLGAQDVSRYASGAYTGEVSAPMLKEIGCRMALVAHSERRQLFAETTETAALKIRLCIDAGLLPVYCVGESTEERNAGKMQETIATQLDAVKDLPVDQYTIAYEPTWAIGTGASASPGQIAEVHGFIKDKLGNGARVFYGGSVKGSNAASVLATPGVDGVLVGGASLNAQEFVEICKAAR
ncbi:triosephosphate isomerase [Formivibrio citricus]|uniref:Triosephosphate isomerase n=1 Tax=Formivibrio citricus TaxID=83765 RepID=A0A1I4WWS6_9NEIS|nr:triose-phosphate isomerase [Formivibrio citricus]SFN17957.1 triosephosphate isomerase [Formivibrio citricus]